MCIYVDNEKYINILYYYIKEALRFYMILKNTVIFDIYIYIYIYIYIHFNIFMMHTLKVILIST